MTVHTQGKMQVQKRPEETLSLHLRLITGTETAYNNKTKKTKQIHQVLGMGENMISKVTTLLDSNVQFSTTIKNHKAYKETRNHGPFKK